MKENNKHITDMQKLAETGWKQMHEILHEHELSSDATELNSSSQKRILFLLIAACVFFILIFSYPFILNDKLDFSFHPNKINGSSTVANSIKPVKTENSTGNKEREITTMTSLQKQLFHEQLNSRLAEFTKENFLKLFQNQKAYLLEKFTLEKNAKITIPSSGKPIDTAIEIERTDFLQKKTTKKASKKIQVFAGAGLNISTAKSYPDLLNAKNLNVHPEISVIIPLNDKFSLHTGLSAFSTIHGKEVSTKEKELVNSFNSNVYYNINTTSIIKATYFDLPLTVHYSIDKNWSVGTGFELSKLYKVNIKEEKQSFDYNNTLAAATVSQFNSTPVRAAAVFERKLEIKKFEPRFVVETNCQMHDFLFSAGYHYGLGKTITLKDSYNSIHQYRNEYFKIGIQYRICGKR